MARKRIIRWQRLAGLDWFEIFTPYNEAFIKEIKLINSKERYWSNENKVWGLRTKHLPRILKTC